MQVTKEIVILTWMILGFINLVVLYYIQKKHHNLIQGNIPTGMFYEVGILCIWFAFAFMIIPYYLLMYYIKLFYIKLKQLEYKLKQKVIKIKKKK